MIIIPLLGRGEVALISVTSDLNVPHPCGLGSPVVHCFQRKGGRVFGNIKFAGM